MSQEENKGSLKGKHVNVAMMTSGGTCIRILHGLDSTEQIRLSLVALIPLPLFPLQASPPVSAAPLRNS